MSSAHRVDVHQHVVPPFYADALASHGGDPSGSVTPGWSPGRAIDFMDSQQIATGILSVSTPSVVGWARDERRQMTRRINEYTADLVAKQPDRFGAFATLPLPDVDGALAEVEHALGPLHADGVVMMASYAGKYLGDPAFEPLWAELGRRQAVVFEHPGDTPGQPPLPPATGVAPPMTDFPFETTRTAVQLVLNGVRDRHPGARIILSHAGGFLPYASLRFAELARVFNPDAPRSRQSPGQLPGLLLRHRAVIRCRPAHSEGLRRQRPHPVRHRLPLRPRRLRGVHCRARRRGQPDRRRPSSH
jgi:aminocarboxymuconate-semialdehyde decarboxylase